MRLYFLLVLISTLLLLQSCTSQKFTGAYSFETECLGIELDGSQTLKAWGRGKNKPDAVEQAHKNAVRDVLFKGIRKGVQECNSVPLILEVNAQQKYEDYFNKFFSDKGLYSKYTTNQDAKFKRRNPDGSDVVYEITVRVLRSELKQQLKNDGILK